MIVLGIDPGLTGALAVVENNDGNTKLLLLEDIPVMRSGSKGAVKQMVNACDLSFLLNGWRPWLAVIERVSAMPKQGVASMFSLGDTMGAIRAVVATHEIPIEYVAPAVWKRAMRLQGGDKEAARARAIQLYPTVAAKLARKADHNRAEAILIAHWWATTVKQV